jgi:RimJ/RimL family protein N-acetyltransferase
MGLAAVEPVDLEGPFVRLEPIAERHREPLRAIAGDARIWTWFPLDATEAGGLDRLVDDAMAALAAGTQVPFVVVRMPDGAVVGSTRYLNIERVHGNLEIGWTWYRPDVWAGVVNPAAKLLLLEHAFDRLGAVRVSLRCDARNARSRAAILRLGAVQEGILRRHMLTQHGVIRDTVQFSILIEEWPEVRAGLERRLAPFHAAAAGSTLAASD